MNNEVINGTVSREEPSLVARINISVRGLVEFILRSGDIDNRRSSKSGPDVMLEGANIHRMIQRRMGDTYHPEYYLRHVIRKSEYEIVIDGRADGVIIPHDYDSYIYESIEFDELLSQDSEQDVAAGSDIADDKGTVNQNEIISDIPEDVLKKKVIIDEIKSTHRDLEKIKEPDEVHLAQAKCYAYLLPPYQLQENNFCTCASHVDVKLHMI